MSKHARTSSSSRRADTVIGRRQPVRSTWRRVRGWRWRRIIGLGVPGLLVLLVGAFLITYALTDVPEPDSGTQDQATVVRYADGTEIARLGTNRTLVDLVDVSEPAQKAVLSAEDRGFYTEPGISPRGIGRALFTNVRGGDVQQGGSTITQQYAKNAFLTQERTYTRKVKEVFISLKMTRERSKEQILQDYLNTIYFGRGALGIQAASNAYFGVPAAELTVAQGAVLASSIRSPSTYDPVRNPERARDRFDYVLDGMVEQGWLTRADRERTAFPDVLETAPNNGTDLSGPEGTVVRAVQDELLAAGAVTEEALERGGLDITTTLDPRQQAAAVAAVQEVTGDDTGGEGLQGALVAVEPGTGQVKAYYGGASGQGIDWAATPNQPGSSMKAYTLATALDQGISLDDRFDGSSPQTFTGGAEVSNFGRGVGRVDLVRMTEDSVNTAFYALAEEVGPDAVADLAYAAGIDRGNALAGEDGVRTSQITLGAYPIRPRDQATGFATFAAGGTSATSYLVARVTAGDETVYEGRASTREAFSEQVAADATFAMEQVVRSGSGTRADLDGGREAAGKTGTTSENRNIWFAGYTPQLAAAVWFGYGDQRTITIDGVSEATGGRIASAAWKQFMDPALEGLPEQDFPARSRGGSESGGDSGGGGGGGSGGGGGGSDDAPSPAPRPTATTSPSPDAPAPTTPAPTTPPPATTAPPAPSPTAPTTEPPEPPPAEAADDP